VIKYKIKIKMVINNKIIELLVKQMLNVSSKDDETKISDFDLEKFRTEFNHNEFVFKMCVSGKVYHGKTSTINALFNLDLPIGTGVDEHGTSEGYEVKQEVEAMPFDFGEGKGKIIIYDLPGLQESVERDKKLLNVYKNVFPVCDVILWIIRADGIDNSFDQVYLNNLSPDIKKKIIIGISKANSYPNRAKMINDIVKNLMFEGEKLSSIIGILGEPDYKKHETIIYKIDEKYGYNIDPIAGRNLEIKFNADSIVISRQLSQVNN
jgi:hypothetical protein